MGCAVRRGLRCYGMLYVRGNVRGTQPRSPRPPPIPESVLRTSKRLGPAGDSQLPRLRVGTPASERQRQDLQASSTGLVAPFRFQPPPPPFEDNDPRRALEVPFYMRRQRSTGARYPLPTAADALSTIRTHPRVRVAYSLPARAPRRTLALCMSGSRRRVPCCPAGAPWCWERGLGRRGRVDHAMKE